MKKALKLTLTILGIIVCLPLVAVILWILWEIIGAVGNQIAANQFTKEYSQYVLDTVPKTEILGTYTFAGNTSGTGNHCELKTVLVIRTETEHPEDLLEFDYSMTDWIKPVEEAREWEINIMNKMDLPDDLDTADCYYINVIKSAPFPDNITGH